MADDEGAIYHMGLGGALLALGMRISGEEGDDSLGQARTHLGEALRWYTREVRSHSSGPQLRTRSVMWIGFLPSEPPTLSKPRGCCVPAQTIIDARWDFCPESRYPTDWANARNSLGGALTELGVRVRGQEGKTCLDTALCCFDDAAGIWGPDHHRTGGTVRNRAIALRVRDSIQAELAAAGSDSTGPSSPTPSP